MPDFDEIDLGPGTLLISAPMMQDPNFRRAVVLICEHNDREGTFGLILNRELDVQLGDVLDEYVTYDPSLYMGGPVQRETLHYLHMRDDIPGGVVLPGDVTWGGDFETVQRLAKGGDAAPDDLRFFLGYAGWGPGQLDDEIGEEAWIPAPGAAEFVFDTSPDSLWRTILRRMGGEYAVLANFPDDPRMN
ncbi:YqgE/AlgH family protein [Salinibacter altiplanensis]|uniref:YqgE/AlgH family protein n=1 Tax=Salinibacter altiplanensis TaxID=1803181 RepID=UPI000C9ED792|nr:YqgE/AlgH family protein [Salinibacter altiplanensis]